MVTTDRQVAGTQLSGSSIANSLVAFAWKATGTLHDARALDGEAGRQAVGAAKDTPGVVTRFVAWIAAAIADELRIRRDMRQLRAMDDGMLNDIGLTRADIGTAVRYGRD